MLEIPFTTAATVITVSGMVVMALYRIISNSRAYVPKIIYREDMKALADKYVDLAEDIREAEERIAEAKAKIQAELAAIKPELRLIRENLKSNEQIVTALLNKIPDGRHS